MLEEKECGSGTDVAMGRKNCGQYQCAAFEGGTALSRSAGWKPDRSRRASSEHPRFLSEKLTADHRPFIADFYVPPCS